MEPNSKKQSKINKIIRKKQSIKSVLLQQFKNQQLQDYQFQTHSQKIKQDQYQLTYIDPSTQVKKAKQWWDNLNCMYFKKLNQKDLLMTRNLTSTSKLINYFNSQSQCKGSYFNEQILPFLQTQDENICLKVLFKSSSPFLNQLIQFSCVNYTSQNYRRVSKNKQNQIIQQQNLQGWKISSLLTNHYNGEIQNQEFQENSINIKQTLKNINFEFVSWFNQHSVLSKMNKFQEIKDQMLINSNQIELELKLWETQAEKINMQNGILWNTLLTNFITQKAQQSTISKYTQDEITHIQQSLIHNTILRYFEHGTKDKTFKMLKDLIQSMKNLKPLKSRDSNNKKFFQTDCKICFCSFNSDSNQVLYCDMCNTSYHLACYGLRSIPEEKEYFCDCCVEIKKQEKLKHSQIKKITCQICCKANFPIKKINGHFYHMTCLVILNFITVQQGRIKLKDNITHEAIQKRVIQNQINCNSCVFCAGTQGSESGMQFRCSYQGCAVSMHPICAYINGCEFVLKRDMKQKGLDVKIFCNKHDVQRDYIQQSYLRRYMCNFKNTSLKTLQSFRAEYQTEITIKQSKLTLKNKTPFNLPTLIMDLKNVKRYISIREQKTIEKNNQIEMTETGKMLQKLIKYQI